MLQPSLMTFSRMSILLPSGHEIEKHSKKSPLPLMGHPP